MTATTATRGRTRVCSVGIGRRQAQCSCGWRGPDRFTDAIARLDQAAHKTADVHRGIHAGPWIQQQQWGPICDITSDDGTLVFDPPNVIWPAGGQRIRIEDYDTDTPIFAIEAFDRTIQRHGMRREAPTVPAMVECVRCSGSGELVRCPPKCDGSHVLDEPYPCDVCRGEGVVVEVAS